MLTALSRGLRRHQLRLWPAVLLALLLLGKLVDPLPLRQLQLVVFDGLQRLAPRDGEPMPVRVVDVDDESLKRLGQWPWPRDQVARLIDRLREAGAAAIVLDMLFAEPDRTSPARVLARYRDRIGPVPDLPDHDALLARALGEIPTVGGFAFAVPGAPRPPRLIAGLAISGPDPKPHLPRFPGAVTDLPEIESALLGYGAINGLPDIDGVTRRMPLLIGGFDQVYPSLLTEAVRVLTGDKTIRIKTAGGSGERSLGAETGIVFVRLGSGEGAITIPTDANGAMPLYFGPSRPERSIAAWRLLGDEPLPDLADQVIVIGSSATGLGDIVLTPLGFRPGVLVQAEALDQALSGLYLERPDWAEGLELIVMLVGGLLLIALLPRLGPGWGTALATSLIAAMGLAAWTAFQQARFQFDPVYPGLCLALVAGGTMLMGFMRAEQQRAFIRNAFSRYLSPALMAQLETDPALLKLGGERREMTFIFTDIAGFTTLSEAVGPAAVAKLLNPYFDQFCQVILAEGGMVNEFIGDAVLAYFGAPLEQADHAARALRAARAMDACAEQFRREQNAAGIPFGATRIGVHSGTALLGNFGATARFKYAALGDVVNTASRIEGLNKHFGTRVCASRVVIDSAGDTGWRPLGEVIVKGRQEAIGIVELLDDARIADPATARYRDAYAALSAGDVERARQQFAALAEADPDDRPAAMHLERIAAGARDTVIVMAEK